MIDPSHYGCHYEGLVRPRDVVLVDRRDRFKGRNGPTDRTMTSSVLKT